MKTTEEIITRLAMAYNSETINGVTAEEIMNILQKTQQSNRKLRTGVNDTTI